MMKSSGSTLDTLVLELSPAERASMLDRLQQSVKVSQEPMFVQPIGQDEPLQFDQVYKSLGLFTRFLLRLRSMFSGMGIADLVRERLLRGMAKELEASSPGLVDAKRGVILEPMYRQILSLRAAARSLYDLFDRTLEKNRPAFFAFLFSLEFESVHQELMEETDPSGYLQNHPDASDNDIRNAMLGAVEGALLRIGEEQRKMLYRDVRSLHVLRKLSSFLYDRLLAAFVTRPDGLHEASIFKISEQFGELATILAAFDQPPSTRLLESILGFVLQEQMESENFDMDSMVARELESVERALTTIRTFNTQVPVSGILRLAHNDPNWQCPQLAAGEDWFATFRAYWKDRVDKAYTRFVAVRRVARLESDIRAILGTENVPVPENLTEAGTEATPPVRYARALGFLYAFYNKVFLGDINRGLKLILLDGEFYRRDNRVEYTDTYNDLLQIGDRIRTLDLRVSAAGDFGQTYTQVCSELVSAQIKKRKIEAAIMAVDTESESVLRKAYESLGRMSEILKAILSRESRGRYDSLSNLNRMDGSANREFIRMLEKSRDTLVHGNYLLGELMQSAVPASIQG